MVAELGHEPYTRGPILFVTTEHYINRKVFDEEDKHDSLGAGVLRLSKLEHAVRVEIKVNGLAFMYISMDDVDDVIAYLNFVKEKHNG